MRLEDFLSQKTELKSYEDGEIVFIEGRQADAAYYIAKGKVEIFKDESAGPSVIATLGPGEIFGEMALLSFDSYTLSARAAARTDLYVISPSMLLDQIRETHPLIKAIISMLIQRVHGANEVLIDLDRANRA